MPLQNTVLPKAHLLCAAAGRRLPNHPLHSFIPQRTLEKHWLFSQPFQIPRIAFVPESPLIDATRRVYSGSGGRTDRAESSSNRMGRLNPFCSRKAFTKAKGEGELSLAVLFTPLLP